MSNIKKIIGVVLAVVMAFSVASIAFAADADEYSVAFEVVDGSTTLAPGDSVTINVNVTADFYVTTVAIPVFFDKTKVDVTATIGDTPANRTTVIEETNTYDVDKYYKGTDYDKATTGARVLVYIAKQGDDLEIFNNKTVMTLVITAKSDASGTTDVFCDAATVKTSTNTNGGLYVGKNGSGNDYLDSESEWIDAADISAATAQLTIGAAAQPADLELTTAGATAGVVIDKNKTFGGRYDGAVYGVNVTGVTLNAGYYNGLVKATNDTALTYTKSIFLARGTTFGTGATITVKNTDNTVAKTYVIIVFGDTTGEGKITSADLGDIKSHIKGTALGDDIKMMAANLVPATRGTDAAKAKALYDVLANDLSAVKADIKGTAALDQAGLAAAHVLYNVYYQ